jgi:diguanylate cyclase (GGDEF)-like protein/putative nucleotidyltransferase with HDIG domain
VRANDPSAVAADRLISLIGALGDGLCATDGAGRLRLANPEARRLLGLGDAVPDVPLSDLLEIGSDAGGPGTRELVADALAGREPVRLDGVRISGGSGHEFVASLVVSQFRHEGGRGAVLAFRDVTDHWLAMRLNRSLHLVGRTAASGDVVRIPQLVASETSAIFGSEALVVRFQADPTTVVGSAGPHSKVGDVLTMTGGGALADVRRTGHPARVDDYSALPAYSPIRAHALSQGYTATIAAPIHAATTLWGALVLTTKRPNGFAAATEERLADFAELMGQAIANGEARAELLALTDSDPLTGLTNHRAFQDRLRAAVPRAREERTPLALALIDIDHFKRINEEHGHNVGDRVLRRIARRLRDLARPGDVLGRVGGEEFAWLMPATSAEEAHDLIEAARQLISGDEVGPVRSVTVSAGVCDLEATDDADSLYRYADGALYWAKTHGRDCVIRYSSAEVEVLSDRERADRLARQQALQGIRILARAVDAKDQTTRRHSERTADLAVQIAEALGWDLPRAARLREAALVHDVGKIAIPDAILQKPGPLGAEERERVRGHATIGAKMVADVLDSEQVAWVRGHHERWDGDGYPDALAGTAIPDGARLLALAEAWDVMTADLPYRTARPVAEAIEECRAASGTQFWPDAVAALERLLTADALMVHGNGGPVRAAGG